MTEHKPHKRPVEEMSREALDYAQQTLDETLPYEESWHFIAEAYVRLFEQLEAAQRVVDAAQFYFDEMRAGKPALTIGIERALDALNPASERRDTSYQTAIAVRNLIAAVRATPGYWLERFQAFAADMERQEKQGKFGKWPWQEDYGLWPWQRRRKGSGS